MIKLKSLLKKESKHIILEQPTGSYRRYVKIGLDRINKLVDGGALNKLTDESKLTETLVQVEKAISNSAIVSDNNKFSNVLNRINVLVSNGALEKIEESIKLIQIQTWLVTVERALEFPNGDSKKAIKLPDGDTNNNGFPDATEHNPELARDIRGYGQGRYQGD